MAFNCPICSASQPDTDIARSHCRQVHNVYLCQDCGTAFPKIEDLFSHIPSHGYDVDSYFLSYNDNELRAYQLSLAKSQAPPPPPRKKTKPKIFNVIHDVFYYKELFKNNKDKMKYFDHVKKQFLDQGYPECEPLNQLCYLMVLARDKNISLARSQTDEGLINTNKDDIREISTLLESIDKILSQLKDTYEKNRKEKNIGDEIQNIINEAHDYVKKNIGEHQFKCSHCGAMVDTYGLPHWAYEVNVSPDGKTTYLLWNQQMWEAIKGIEVIDKFGIKTVQSIEPYWVCYFLETSIEGLIFTAKQRGMKVERREESDGRIAYIDGVRINIAEQEEKFRNIYELFKALYHKRSYRNL